MKRRRGSRRFRELKERMGEDPSRAGRPYRERELDGMLDFEDQTGIRVEGPPPPNRSGDFIGSDGRVYELKGPVPEGRYNRAFRDNVKRILEEHTGYDALVVDVTNATVREIKSLKKVLLEAAGGRDVILVGERGAGFVAGAGVVTSQRVGAESDKEGQ